MKKIHPAKAGKLRVSQSLMKDMRKYLSKDLCGIVLESKYIKHDFPEAVEIPLKSTCNAMLVGTFFEFLVTGAFPKSGVQPQPKYGSKGITGRKEDYYQPYRNAQDNAERVKKYFKSMGIEVIAAGVHVTKGDHEGTLDIIAKYKKEYIVIDLKHSGLLDNKWEEMGWAEMLKPGMNQQKRYHGTQAMEYHYLSDEACKKLKLPVSKLPVYFLVKDSGDNNDVLFLETKIGEYEMEAHLTEAAKVLNHMKFFEEIGFTPYPEIGRCSKCPLVNRCAHKVLHPEPVIVYIEDDI